MDYTPSYCLMGNYQQATFTLAGEGNFVGLHDPNDTWNGFANPLFTISTVRKIIELVNEQNALSDEPQDELRILTVGYTNMVLLYSAEDGTTEQMPSSLLRWPADGLSDIYYAVMNNALCWSVAPEQNPTSHAPTDSPAVSSEV